MIILDCGDNLYIFIENGDYDDHLTFNKSTSDFTIINNHFIFH